MALQINFERFYEKLKNRYGDMVDIVSEYKGHEKPITIIYHCVEHGDTRTTINAKKYF